jgi:hypothetical protein
VGRKGEKVSKPHLLVAARVPLNFCCLFIFAIFKKEKKAVYKAVLYSLKYISIIYLMSCGECSGGEKSVRV